MNIVLCPADESINTVAVQAVPHVEEEIILRSPDGYNKLYVVDRVRYLASEPSEVNPNEGLTVFVFVSFVCYLT